MTCPRSVAFMKALTEKALASQRIVPCNASLPQLETAYYAMRQSAKQGFYSIQYDEAPVLKNAEVQEYLKACGFHVNTNGVSWISDHLA